jgi:hypothetical protein
MHRIDGSDVVLAVPTPSAVGTPGYFRKADTGTATKGTVVSTDWLNAVQEEIAGVIEGAGLALSKTDRGQLSAAIGGGAAVKSHATDTGVVTTSHLRAVIASAAGQADGAAALVMACGSTCRASGTQSAVICSDGSHASGAASAIVASTDADCSGTNSAVIASIGAMTIAGTGAFVAASVKGSGSGIVTTGGAYVAAIACTGGTGTCAVDGIQAAAIGCGEATDVGGTQAVALAVAGCTLPGTNVALAAATTGDVGGTRNFGAALSGTAGTFNAASSDCVMFASSAGSGFGANAQRSALVACNDVDCGDTGAAVNSGGLAALYGEIDGNRSGMAFSEGADATNKIVVTGADSAAIGVNGGLTISGSRTIVVASSTTGAGPAVSENDVLAGVSGAAIVWKLNSSTGKATVQSLDVNDGIALGGGAAPTLGTIGGSGPTAAGQAQWLRVSIGGTAHYIPAWT